MEFSVTSLKLWNVLYFYTLSSNVLDFVLNRLKKTFSGPSFIKVERTGLLIHRSKIEKLRRQHVLIGTCCVFIRIDTKLCWNECVDNRLKSCVRYQTVGDAEEGGYSRGLLLVNRLLLKYKSETLEKKKTTGKFLYFIEYFPFATNYTRDLNPSD